MARWRTHSLTYPRHNDALNVSHDVTPLFRCIGGSGRQEGAQIPRLHIGQHTPAVAGWMDGWIRGMRLSLVLFFSYTAREREGGG